MPVVHFPCVVRQKPKIIIIFIEKFKNKHDYSFEPFEK